MDYETLINNKIEQHKKLKQEKKDKRTSQEIRLEEVANQIEKFYEAIDKSNLRFNKNNSIESVTFKQLFHKNNMLLRRSTGTEIKFKTPILRYEHLTLMLNSNLDLIFVLSSMYASSTPNKIFRNIDDLIGFMTTKIIDMSI